MTLTGALRIPLNKILEQLRPDWTPSEINAATTTLADDPHSAATLCAQAITRAGNDRLKRAVAITWPEIHPPVHETLTQDQPCPTHGGLIRRPDGRFHCCVIDDWWPDYHPPHPPRPVPTTAQGLIARFRAERQARRTTQET